MDPIESIDLTSDVVEDEAPKTSSSSSAAVDSVTSSPKTKKKRKRVSKPRKKSAKKSKAEVEKKGLPPWVNEARSAFLSILWQHPRSASSSPPSSSSSRETKSALSSEPTGSLLETTSSAALDLLRAASITTESAYVAHARFIISHVLSSPATRHLFSQDELALFEKFKSLSPQAAGLAIRVFQRKGPWMRTTTFRRYAEDLSPDVPLTGPIEIPFSDEIFEVLDINNDDKVTEGDVGMDEVRPSALDNSAPQTAVSPPVLRAMGSSSLFRIIDQEREAPGSVSGRAMAERMAKKQSLKSFGSEGDETKSGKQSKLVPAIWVQNAVVELVAAGIARGLPNAVSASPPSTLPQQRESSSDSIKKSSKPSTGFASIFNTPRALAAKSPAAATIASMFKSSAVLPSEVKLPFSFEETLAAISCAFTADELRSVAQRLGLPSLKATGSSFKTNTSSFAGAGSALVSSSGRAALISQINTCMRSQRSVMGGPLPLTQAFTWVLTRPDSPSFDYAAEIESIKTSTKKKTFSFSSSSSKPTQNSSSYSTPHLKETRSSSAPIIHLMRLQPSFSSLLRRAHCLFYIAPSSAMLSSGMGSGSWPFADEADADEDQENRSSATSSVPETICIIDDDDDAPSTGLRALETISSFRPNFEDYLNEETSSVHSQQQTAFLQGSMSKYSDSAASESPLLLALSSKAQASLSSPGLALIFRKLDVCPTISPRPLKLFSSRLELTMWEFANLFRAQTDARSVFSFLPEKATDVKANRADDVTARALQFPWEEGISTKEDDKNVDEAILIDDGDAEEHVIENDSENDEKASNTSPPPLLAGIALLPFALQLIGIPPSHALTSAVLSCRDAKMGARVALEAASKIEGNLGALGTGQAALFGVGAGSLLFLLKSLIPVAAAVAAGVPSQASACLSSLAKAKAISNAIFASSPALLVAYRASLCLALHTVSTHLLSSRATSLDNHPFLHQFSPGSLYSTILWEAVDPLERTKHYLLAALFLSQLTSPSIPSLQDSGGRFTPHRSGRWWTRLSLNLSHLGLTFDSQFVTQESLRCVDVRAGDRYSLAERSQKLSEALKKKHDKPLKKISVQDSSDIIDVTSSQGDSIIALKDVKTIYIPLLMQIAEWSKEAYNPLHPFTAINDSFVHAPLATAVGAKSSFLSSIDVENDGSDDEILDDKIEGISGESKSTNGKKANHGDINITVQVFQQIGLDFSILGQPTFCVCVPVWIKEQKKRDLLALKAEEQIDDNEEPPPTELVTVDVYAEETIDEPVPEQLISSSSSSSSLSSSSSSSSSSSAHTEPVHSQRWIKTSDGRSIQVKSKTRDREEGPSMPFSSMRVNVEELSLLFYNNPLDAAIPQADEAASINEDILKYAPGLDGGGWRGIHCEGSPLRSLFALFLWDVLFPSSVDDAPEGAFVTAFQDAPLDLDSPSVFYYAREEIIKKRLHEITMYTQIELCREIGKVWRERYGQVCRGMKWSGLPMQALQIIAMGLGGPSIACLCDAFCFDYRHLTGGMPDLLLWRITTSQDAATSFSMPSTVVSGGWHGPDVDLIMPNVLECSIEVRLVEVKGPRDHLSEKQIVWLRIFELAGINHGVVKILESRKEKGKQGKK